MDINVPPEYKKALRKGLSLSEISIQLGYNENNDEHPLFVETLRKDNESSITSTTIQTEYQYHPQRLKRWRELNEYFPKIRKQK